jgi:cyclin L
MTSALTLESLSNALATPAQLTSSSSSLDGIPSDLESSIRFAGALLTQAAGVLLRLPQDVITQAIVIFTRFWIGPDGGSFAIHSAKVSLRNCQLLNQSLTSTGRICSFPLSNS